MYTENNQRTIKEFFFVSTEMDTVLKADALERDYTVKMCEMRFYSKQKLSVRNELRSAFV